MPEPPRSGMRRNSGPVSRLGRVCHMPETRFIFKGLSLARGEANAEIATSRTQGSLVAVPCAPTFQAASALIVGARYAPRRVRL
jgi:hypothetical protein